MRVIGHLATETSARRFSDFLLVQGIHNLAEEENGSYAIWIHSEDEIPKAKEYLQAFNANPKDPRFNHSSTRAAEIKAQEVREEERATQRMFDRTKIFKSTTPYGVGPVTLLLIMACVVVAALTGWGNNLEVANRLFITSVRENGSFIQWNSRLPEVMRGEFWRLLTPTFLHFGFLHIFFNMLCLFDLGSMVEARESPWKLLGLVVVISVLANFAQFHVSSPLFGGMSGVIYGLLGYVWMKGKFDPASGLYLHPQTVAMMFMWYVFCLATLIPGFGASLGMARGVANTVHTVGLVIGLVWGFFSSKYQRRRRA
jgi:GlpG protein